MCNSGSDPDLFVGGALLLISWRSGSDPELLLQHAAAHLIELDRLEQRLEVALAEALVALPLDELEEDRPELVLGEDLQQQRPGLAVDEDLALLQLGKVLAVARDALVDELVVGVDGVEELHAFGAH